MEEFDRRINMIIKKMIAAKLIDRSLSIIEQEMSRSTSDHDATLIEIKRQLLKMKDKMSPHEYRPSYNHILIDSWWGYDHKYDPLFKAYDVYMRL